MDPPTNRGSGPPEKCVGHGRVGHIRSSDETGTPESRFRPGHVGSAKSRPGRLPSVRVLGLRLAKFTEVTPPSLNQDNRKLR